MSVRAGPPSRRTVLVTGGAGHIGSHTAKALHARGYVPVVFDNLNLGHREAVRWGPFVHGDICNGAALRETIDLYKPDAAIHFAGLIEVGRSIVRPDLFFDINVMGLTQTLGLTVFGQDFETPDGTCLRDYIHVTDLAAAHVAALDAHLTTDGFVALNVGTGTGHWVAKVVAAVSAAAGRAVPHNLGPRRAGDPANLVADPGAALKLLGWRPEQSSLDEIVADAQRWHARPAFGKAPEIDTPPLGHRRRRLTSRRPRSSTT